MLRNKAQRKEFNEFLNYLKGYFPDYHQHIMSDKCVMAIAQMAFGQGITAMYKHVCEGMRFETTSETTSKSSAK